MLHHHAEAVRVVRQLLEEGLVVGGALDHAVAQAVPVLLPLGLQQVRCEGNNALTSALQCTYAFIHSGGIQPQ